MSKHRNAAQVAQVANEQVIAEMVADAAKLAPQPKVVPLEAVEQTALRAADSTLKQERRLLDTVRDLIVHYTKAGIPVAEMPTIWQSHCQAADVWPRKTAGGDWCNTVQARDTAAGRVWNTLSARRGRVKVDADGAAVLDKGSVVWVEPEKGKREAKTETKAGASDAPPTQKQAREAAAAETAANEGLGNILAQVYHLRRELEVLRPVPMFANLLAECESRFRQIELDVKDLSLTFELDERRVIDAADALKVKVS